MANEEYRFSSGPYSGLTASEVAQRAQTAETSNQQIVAQVQQYVNSQRAQPPPQATPTAAIDPDLWLTDPAKAQALMQQQTMAQVQQYVNSAGQPLLVGQASTARATSQSDPSNKEIWQKYGHEVETLMSRVPLTQRTQKEMWDQAVKMVRSEHVEEISQERALTIAANMPHSETGSTGGSPGVTKATSGAIQKIRESEYGKSHLDGYSDAHLIETAKKMGDTIDQYANMITSTHIISHPKKPGEWVNKDLVRDV